MPGPRLATVPAVEQREPYWRGVLLRLPVAVLMGVVVGLVLWWPADLHGSSAVVAGFFGALAGALLPPRPRDRRPAD
ncbi:hypothetical protein SAMN05444351_3099 [Geodermatophilus nigrescens]|uniref:Uncharacterized protein n=1 Tax=Geodermatophilus nigrescens TaxID=1070870 RepID=A0A1M5MAM8_9ACTN|nr:hypothetical protein SAMN05444351_3099 [Geodermatophilus nigrescens]